MIRFPEQKCFAFTVVDDTDFGTVASVAPVYDWLAECGLRTTKTVWTIGATEPVRIGGASLDEPEYLDFVLRLRDQGFEIASHGATSHGVPRYENIRALELFRRRVGCYPRLHCNHYLNRDGLYWGQARLSNLCHRLIYSVANFGKKRRFEGHVVTSPFFWGDVARRHIRYVRNFVFSEINLCRAPGRVLYSDPKRPFVDCWFTSTRAPDVESFLATLSDANQERLQQEGGICILYTHFGSGFVTDGVLNPGVRHCIRQMAARPGWFVPASELLDYLRTEGLDRPISSRERTAMERSWLFEKLSNRLRWQLRHGNYG